MKDKKKQQDMPKSELKVDRATLNKFSRGTGLTVKASLTRKTDSVRLGSTRLGSARFGSVRFDLTRLDVSTSREDPCQSGSYMIYFIRLSRLPRTRKQKAI